MTGELSNHSNGIRSDTTNSNVIVPMNGLMLGAGVFLSVGRADLRPLLL